MHGVAVRDRGDAAGAFAAALAQQTGRRSRQARDAGAGIGARAAHTDGERSEYAPEDFPDESLMLSGDLNIIDVEWVVQYRISDPMK